MEKMEPMSDAYNRARKWYGVVVGLLLAWELIDIQFTSISAIGVTFANPTNVPHVLVILLGYFAIRFLVEWHQSNPDQCSRGISRFDYRFAHALAIAAVLIYFIQRILDIPVARLLDKGFITGSFLGFLLLLGGLEIKRYKYERQTDKLRMFTFVSLMITPSLLLIFTFLTTDFLLSVALGVLFGAGGAFTTWSILKRILHR